MWSALPFRTDAADVIPQTSSGISDSLKDVDVFYIYPTIYQRGKTWCADINNKKLNKKIDALPVHFQASVFNASCRVYARSLIVRALSPATMTRSMALRVSTSPIRMCAELLFIIWNITNHGRPIIIASRGQGGKLAPWRLLREFFDTTALRKQLVCSY
jgi:hypothetical protein